MWTNTENWRLDCNYGCGSKDSVEVMHFGGNGFSQCKKYSCLECGKVDTEGIIDANPNEDGSADEPFKNTKYLNYEELNELRDNGGLPPLPQKTKDEFLSEIMSGICDVSNKYDYDINHFKTLLKDAFDSYGCHMTIKGEKLTIELKYYTPKQKSMRVV